MENSFVARFNKSSFNIFYKDHLSNFPLKPQKLTVRKSTLIIF